MKKVLLSVAALFAAVSLSAQDLTAVYNEAAAAYGAKDFAGAAAKFQQVIDEGMDAEGSESLVATAKSTLPKCYFMMGGYAAQAKKYDEALTNFSKSAELADRSSGLPKSTSCRAVRPSTTRTTPPHRRFSPRATLPTPAIRTWHSTWR